MVSKNLKVPWVPKYEEVRELINYQVKKTSLSPAARSKVINKSGSNYVSESRENYGPCLVGDMSNFHCSKEELERQKVQIELQREKEKLEAERKQREREEEKRLREEIRWEKEKRRELEEKAQKERYKYFWEK